MYRILINNEIFVDSRTDELRVVDPVIELEVNTAGTLTMTVPQTHPYYDKLVERQSFVEVYIDRETEPVFAGCLASYSNDFYNSRTAVFEGELSYLNDSVQRPKEYSNKTTRQLLEAYIAAHNSSVEEAKRFEVGMVTVDGGSSIHRYTNWNSTMTEIAEDLIDNYGGYLRVRHQDGHRYLDYLAEATRTSSQQIRLGENLMDFKSNLDTTEVCTVLIPLGATIEQETQPIEGLEEYVTIKSVNNNKDYLESSAISTYGRIEKTNKWDDVTSPSILKSKGQAYLQDIQFANVYIEANAIDLHYDDPSIERIRLMDNVRVVSKYHGINRVFFLTKMTINLDNPGGDTFTLGVNVIPTLSAASAEAAKKMEKLDDVPEMSTVMSAISNATAMITGADGGHVYIKSDSTGKPCEILIMDTDNIATAQKVWRWNQNGFGYSSTGYNGTYGTAITMDGSIIADYITAGVLTGIAINNGSGTFSVDANGNLTASGVNISGDVRSNSLTLIGSSGSYSSITPEVMTNMDGTTQPAMKMQRALCIGNASIRGEATINGTLYHPAIFDYAEASETSNHRVNVGLPAYDNLGDTETVVRGKNVYLGTAGSNVVARCSDDVSRKIIGTTNSTETSHDLICFMRTTDSSPYAISVRGQWGATEYSSHNIQSSSSDIRLKENVEDSDINALEDIARMKVRQFDWKSSGKHQNIGFIADELDSEVNESLTFGGGYDEDGAPDYKSIDTLMLSAYSIKGIQELIEKVNSLEKEIKLLKGEKE